MDGERGGEGRVRRPLSGLSRRGARYLRRYLELCAFGWFHSPTYHWRLDASIIVVIYLEGQKELDEERALPILRLLRVLLGRGFRSLLSNSFSTCASASNVTWNRGYYDTEVKLLKQLPAQTSDVVIRFGMA